MKTIMIAAIKGGAGKTTTAAALAQAAKADGLRVLAIDTDPQANLTTNLGADQTRPGLLDVLRGNATAASVIQQTEQGIDVISAHSDLATLTAQQGTGLVLDKALHPIRGNYHYCFIDTPPQWGLALYSALYAADYLLIPTETDTNSMQGVTDIATLAKRAAQQSKHNLQIMGVVVTRYDGRSTLNRQLRDSLATSCAGAGIPYRGEIRQGIAAREAAVLRRSLFEYAPKSKPAADYLALWQQIRQQ